ncbi:ABC transporter substrate-binding protein [Glutamicibacter sp. MNS18]|uniref:ABC transporter substrate-binding protein n=1 Tax=Glutamicibacter sp. MNS18 TaxID=2989817 RepID=UPI00223572B1|nr:ABC transporter substrate-binding protein [Glutamicibacter sp. MNS18]MCW4466070.1 ABC transporter substrate-binding protein [Glutamicibacter sp. MNS18]
MRHALRRTTLALLLPMVLAATSCQGPASGTASANDRQVALLTPALPDTLNPLAGFDNNGTGKVNESLYTLEGEPDSLPRIVPLLAAGEPRISTDGLAWTVALRTDVEFSDGSGFDAQDVVASFRTVMDPASASPIAGTLENLADVEALDGHTVRFTLKESQVSFGTALLIGIVPSELVEPGQPVGESLLNREPVGTGPYLVESFSASQLVLTANARHHAGAPEVARVVYEAAEDDNARSQRLATGGFTGTVLPPRLAFGYADREGFEVVNATSADWRGISLPADHPLTGDPTVRLALNLAVDRRQLIDAVLAGAGREAHTFVPAEYGEAYNPEAVFDHDPQRAIRLLEQAGWKPGADGMLDKNGQPAEFTIMYNPGDILRRDLSLALASQLERIGVRAAVEAATFDEAEPRIDQDAIMLGGGDTPYDVDTQLYKMLHSSYPQAGAYYDNPSHFASKEMDRALHTGRTSVDPASRQAAYRKVQQLYAEQPSMLLIAFVDHTYVQRSDVHETWNTTGTLLEPHDHGTAWAPGSRSATGPWPNEPAPEGCPAPSVPCRGGCRAGGSADAAGGSGNRCGDRSGFLVGLGGPVQPVGRLPGLTFRAHRGAAA